MGHPTHDLAITRPTVPVIRLDDEEFPVETGTLISFPRRRPSRLDAYGADAAEPRERKPAPDPAPDGGPSPKPRARSAATVDAAFTTLSNREWDVLWLLAEGLSDRAIATRLGIGRQTVRTHMAGLLGKLGAESRLQALVIAVRHGKVTVR